MGLSSEEESQVREAAIAELRSANMENMTERKLRTALEGRLGLKLGGEEEKLFLREVISQFLEENEPEEEAELPVKRRKTSEKEPAKEGGRSSSEAKQVKEGGHNKAAEPAKRQIIGDGNLLVCELSGNKKVTVAKWKNQKLVSIREYYEKDGEQFPGKKGIALTLEQWNVLRQNIDQVDQALEEL